MNYFPLLLLLLTLNSNFALADDNFECFKSKIKVPYRDNKVETEEVTICTNKDRTSLRSKGCSKLECLPKTQLGKIKSADVFADSGSPGFKICHFIGGNAQLVQFQADNKWYELDRCLIKKEFVNVGILLDYIEK